MKCRIINNSMGNYIEIINNIKLSAGLHFGELKIKNTTHFDLNLYKNIHFLNFNVILYVIFFTLLSNSLIWIKGIELQKFYCISKKLLMLCPLSNKNSAR